jgi:hypothetical protein
MCPHTTIYLYVSSYYILQAVEAVAEALHYYMCALILRYMCPNTTIYLAPSYYHILQAVEAVAEALHYYICVLILRCVLILLYIYMFPHTTIYCKLLKL